MEKLLEFKERICKSELFKKLANFLNKFYSSDLYIITLFIIAIINWKFKLIWLVVITYSIFIFLIYFFKLTKLKLLPIAISLIIAIRYDLINNYFLPLLIVASILSIVFIINFIRKRPKINNGIFLGMLFILFSMIFSLVNTPVLTDSMKAIGLWSFYTILYLYLLNLDDIIENKKTARFYLAKVFVYLSLAVFIEVVIYYLEYGLGENIIRFYGSNDVHFGWANTTTVATLYLLIMPILLYYYTLDQKKYYLLLIVGLNLAILHLMLSRGAYLAMIILGLPLLLKIVSDVKHKTNFIITLIYLTIIALLIILLVAIPTGYIKEFFDFLSSKGLSIEDIELMSRIGFRVFQRYPLLGAGANSANYYISIAIDNRFYDNFVIETLANMGLVGLISFGYYLYQIVRYCIKKNKYNSYVLIVVIAIIIQGLMETTFYNPLVMIILVFIFPLLETEKDISE